MKNIPADGHRRRLLLALGTKNPCHVLLVAEDDSASVYQKHEGNKL